MKKIMQRIMSVLLAVSMLSGFLPMPAVSGEVKATAAEPVELTYVLKGGDGATGDVWVGSDNTPENAKWQMGASTVGASGKPATITHMADGGILFGASSRFANLEWFLVRINVPAAGEYNMTLKTVDNMYYGPMDIYAVKGNTNPLSVYNTHMGTIDAEYSSAKGAMTTTMENTLVVDEAGVYTVAVYPKPGKGCYVRVNSITLTPYVEPEQVERSYVFNSAPAQGAWSGDDTTPATSKWSLSTSTGVSVANGGLSYSGAALDVLINVPSSGEYDISVDAYNDASCGDAKVYIAPQGKDVTSDESYNIGTLFAPAQTGKYTRRFGKVSFEKAGVYTMRFAPTSDAAINILGATLGYKEDVPDPTLVYKLDSLPSGDTWDGDIENIKDLPWQLAGTSQERQIGVTLDSTKGIKFGSGSHRFEDGVGIEWYQIKINVPTAGTYRMVTENLGGRYYAFAQVYVAPEGEDPGADENLVGKVPRYAEDGVVYEYEPGTVTFAEPGIYTVRFRMGRHNGFYHVTYKIKLIPEGYEPAKDIDFRSLEVIPSQNTAYVGDPAVYIRPVAYDSKGKAIDISDAEITYSYKNAPVPESASVDFSMTTTNGYLTAGDYLLSVNAPGNISLKATANQYLEVLALKENWFAYKLGNLKAGDYTGNISYLQYSGGCVFNYYIVPEGDVSQVSRALETATPFISLDGYGSRMDVTKNVSVNLPEDGKYMLVGRYASGNTYAPTVNLHAMYLKRFGIARANSGGSADVGGEAAATVDADGMLTGVKKGLGEVTARVVLGGYVREASCAISVEERKAGDQMPITVDFGDCAEKGHSSDPLHATCETCGWQINLAAGSGEEYIAEKTVDKNGLVVKYNNEDNDYLSIDIPVNKGGYYQVELTYPRASEETKGSWHGVRVGRDGGLGGWVSFSMYGNDKAQYGGLTVATGVTFIPTGTFTINLYADFSTTLALARVRLVPLGIASGALTMSPASEVPEMNVNTQNLVYIDAKLSGGAVRGDMIDMRVSSEDESIATAEVRYSSDNTSRTVKISTFEEGSTTIKLEALLYGEPVGELLIPVTVKEPSVSSAKIVSDALMINVASDGMQLRVEGTDALGEAIGIANAQIVWESKNEDVATIDENGWLKPVSAGEVEVVANINAWGFEQVISRKFSVRDGKVKRSFYTDEKVQNALENISKYAWAKREQTSAISAADKYVELGADYLWKSVTSEDLPRSTYVGYFADPASEYCRYCNTNLVEATSNKYPWLIDPINKPWQLQCPECRRVFPSNDFASFYELGIGEDGSFHRDLALARNEELVKSGHEGYLTNTRHPEMDEHIDKETGELKNEGVHNWGVDDGWGYINGKTYNGNNVIRPAYDSYIAYYNHWAVWYGGTVEKAINALTTAYVLTDDPKYGRVGAILTDRIADIWPTLNYEKFGGGWFSNLLDGKAVDKIWSTGLASSYAKAYDAFFNMYDDPQVVDFLQKKKKQYPALGDKSSSEALRQNCEDGILRENFRALKGSDLLGNFGYHQLTAAVTAVVMDNAPETEEVIEWMFANGHEIGSAGGVNTGGNIWRQIFTLVDRDGMGDESAPGYNGIWVNQIGKIADVLTDYGLVDEKYDLYKHPLVRKMFDIHMRLTLVGRSAPQIADCGSFAMDLACLSPAVYVRAYKITGEPRYAQYAYFLNGNSAEGLKYDIYTKNPESPEQEIRDAIAKYGEYDGFNKSDQLAGYGFSILRGGNRVVSQIQENTHNTLHDYWMYYGYSGKYGTHSHEDPLNIGIDAYGVYMSADFGYPSNWGTRYTDTILAHNSVQINGKEPEGIGMKDGRPAYPMHFDDSGVVKVMDVDAENHAYAVASKYRRTLISVAASDEISYAVDLFRVNGGDQHIYSFHPVSDEVCEMTGLKSMTERGGTYAGENVEFGKTGSMHADVDSYITSIREDFAPDSVASVDYRIMDFRNYLHKPMDLHLRVTMLGADELSDLTLGKIQTPRIDNNPQWMETLLARRKGSNLNSLFQTVFEPYADKRYISTIEQVPVTCNGAPVDRNEATAIKVTLENGRIDYIVNTENTNKLYHVDNLFDFQGFVGVYMLDKSGNLVCVYGNDASVIGDKTAQAAVTGTVSSFTEGNRLENVINVAVDGEVDVDALAGKWIYVNNDKLRNAAYPIKGAKLLEDGTVELDIGDITLVRNLKAIEDGDMIFNYNIAPGQTFRIPMTIYADTAPTITPIAAKSVTAGKSISFGINAESSEGREITIKESSLPRGASLKDGVITWTPDNNQIGKYVITVDVSDGVFTKTVSVPVTVFRSSGAADSAPTTPTTPSVPDSGNDDSNAGSGTQSGTDSGAGAGSGAGGGGASGGGGGGVSSGGDTSGDSGNTETDDNTGDNAGNVRDDVLDVPPEKFIDLGNHTWAKDAIYALVDAGVINGTSENTYSPAHNIKRADFAIMLVRAFGIKSGEGENFADVDANKYYAEELRLAKVNGIVNGIGNDKFNPEGEITRQDMMLMLTRALEAQGKALEEADESVLSQFADAAEISDYARSAVASVVKAGVIAGSSGRINPLEKATRAEIAVMLSRVLAK